MYAIVPVFAFSNAGVAFTGLSDQGFPAGVSIGIACGLVSGITIGVFGLSWVDVKLRLADLPEGVNWLLVFGMALLCGIGFTMSLFIGTLAFEDKNEAYGAAVRVGVLGGSLVAAIAGIVVLKRVLRKSSSPHITPKLHLCRRYLRVSLSSASMPSSLLTMSVPVSGHSTGGIVFKQPRAWGRHC